MNAHLASAMARMTLHGASATVEMARKIVAERKIPTEALWTFKKGSLRYVSAVLSGDLVSDEVRAARLGKGGCGDCEDRRVSACGMVHYCGEPLVPHMDAPRPTCGCLLEGKASVASERCPQSRWVQSVRISVEGTPCTTSPPASPS